MARPLWIDQPLSELRGEALRRMPPFVGRLVAHASRTWRLEEVVVLAAALHQLAASIGRRHRVRRGFRSLACGFNLVICHRHHTRTAILERLGEPWLRLARLGLRYHQEVGPAMIEREYRQQVQARLSDEGGTHMSALMASQALDTSFARKPVVFVRSPLASRLLQALEHSGDRAVVSLRGGLDPAAELISAGRSAIAQMGSLLSDSWEDFDLQIPGGLDRRAVVTLGWETHGVTARQLLLGRKSPWLTAPPPVLFIRQACNPPALGILDPTIHDSWAKVLEGQWRAREQRADPVVWELGREALEQWGEFHRELMDDAGAFAPFPETCFEWLPALMPKLALLLSLQRPSRPSHSRQTNAREVIDGAAADDARAVARWLAREHFECLRELLSPSSDTRIGTLDGPLGAANTGAIMVDAGILQKLQSKGPCTSRELQRAFHKIRRDDLEDSLRRLAAQRAIVYLTDGRLSLAPAEADPAESIAQKLSRFPCKAVWRNADHDRPITLVSLMGVKDGREYYKSQDGTGIPADELYFEDEALP